MYWGFFASFSFCKVVHVTSLTLCMIFYRMLIFFKITFFKMFFLDCIRVSKSLDSDQVQCFVGPELRPICLGRSSADYDRR